MTPDLVVRSRRVILPDGCRQAAVAVGDGRILEVLPYAHKAASAPELDAGDSVVMAGLVDTHVHVNDPGRADWEGFDTATKAAAAGGITTLVDMPLNSIPVTTTLDALKAKMTAAAGHCQVDIAFWGGVVPGNASELEPMVKGGALGFKAFLIHSGIDDFPKVDETELRQAMRILAALGAPLLVHAELEVSHPSPEGDPRRYRRYLESRPRAWENEAVSLMVRLCRETGCRVHIVHLSSAEALPAVRRAKGEGLPLTAETCPHYLSFAAEDIPDGRTEFKCAPPIRERENRERLWEALKAGAIDFIVSDHSPCLPELKSLPDGDFGKAWGGISSVQLTLPAVWTEARRRGFGVDEVALWMCDRPAAFAGLGDRKGRIARGYDADLVVWNPEGSFRVEAARILHKHKLTPYEGRTLEGTVELTLLRGETVFERGNLPGEPLGRLLAKEGAHGLHRAR